MSSEYMDPEIRELEFNRAIVADYLRLGSVDEIFRVHNYDLPISYPGVHRILNRWGIIKAAGPNTALAESLGFFARLLEEQMPLERLYKRMPPSFKTSMSTLHRIYGHIKTGVREELEYKSLRRVGTALVITPHDDRYKMLVGFDVSTPRLDLGKPYGSISIPMGFSKKKEPRYDSILRVLQQEVFAQDTILQTFPYKVIPKDPNPFMYLDIADVRVAVFNIHLPLGLSALESLSSFKLNDLSFVDAVSMAGEIEGSSLRMGLTDIARGYVDILSRDISYIPAKPIYQVSGLNLGLSALAYEHI